MTNTQHTPGPWTINTVNPHCIQIRAKKGNTEFECSTAILGGWDTTPAENEANARLIAAAPETAAERDRLKALNAELLEALEKLVRWQACAVNSVNGKSMGLPEAIALIAKATGN